MNPSTWTCWHIGIAGAAVCGVLTLAGYLAVVRPVQAALGEEAVLRTQLETHRRQADALAASQIRFAGELQVARKELADGTLQLRPADHLNARLAELATLVESAGMVIDGTELDRIATGPWYQMVPIELSGTGRFSDCARFLRELHQRMPDTGVTGFRLAGNPAVAGAPSQFTIDLVWYAAPKLSASAE